MGKLTDLQGCERGQLFAKNWYTVKLQELITWRVACTDHLAHTGAIPDVKSLL